MTKDRIKIDDLSSEHFMTLLLWTDQKPTTWSKLVARRCRWLFTGPLPVQLLPQIPITTYIGPISKSRVEWAWSPTAIIHSHNNNNRKWREYNLQSYSWQIKSLGHLRDYYLNYFFLCQGHTKHGDVHSWSNPRAINWLFFIAPSPLLLNQLSGVRWWCPPHYPLNLHWISICEWPIFQIVLMFCWS